MHLESLAIQNYRAFREAEVRLPASGLVLVIGPNNSGKTAFLSALDIIAGSWDGRAPRHAGSSEGITLTARFQLSEEDRAELFRTVDADDAWRESQALRLLEFHFSEPAPGVFIGDGLRTSQDDGQVVDIARVDWVSGQAQGTLFIVPLRDWFKGRHPSAPFEYQNFGVTGVGNTISNLEHQNLTVLQPFLQRWRSSYYHFRALRTGTSPTRPLRAAPHLSPTGENLPEALLYLYTQQLPAWALIRDTMEEIVPDVGELITPASQDQVEAAFIDPFLNVRHNIKDLGTGVEQVLLTTYVGITQPSGAVIVVEEPETNLHPEAQRRLLEHLLKWSADKLFIVSTHSSVFLDRSAKDIPVWLVQRKEGIATLSPADPSLANVLEAVGVRLGDVLSSERILIVEGDYDGDILRTWFPALLNSPRVALVTGRGGDAAWHAETVQRLIEAGDVLERRVLFIRDRDELRGQLVDQLQETGVVHVLKRREVENYLLDPEGLARVLGQRLSESGRQDGKTPTTEAISTTLKEEAEPLRPMVVLKRVAQTVLPVRLLDRVSVTKLAEESPTLEALLETVKSRLPSPDALREIETTWQRIEKEVTDGWSEHWAEWAPGAELLDSLWQRYGLRYDKKRDGPDMATVVPAPDEIRHALESFLVT